MKDTVNSEDNVLYKFSGYKNKTFHSKYVIMIVLYLVGVSNGCSKIFSWRFKYNIPLILKTIFHIILVVISMSLNVKPLKKFIYFSY